MLGIGGYPMLPPPRYRCAYVEQRILDAECKSEKMV